MKQSRLLNKFKKNLKKIQLAVQYHKVEEMRSVRECEGEGRKEEEEEEGRRGRGREVEEEEEWASSNQNSFFEDMDPGNL